MLPDFGSHDVGGPFTPIHGDRNWSF